jgi:CRISPR-associated endoribonuclease Cas6
MDLMRLHISLSPNTKKVHFDYQHKLAGIFHKWLGRNDLHDKISLYSISWLEGGRFVNGALDFPKGAKFFVSFYEEQYAKALVKGILNEPSTFNGMSVTDVVIEETPQFSNKERFLLASPVFIKWQTDTRTEHILYDHPIADERLTATLQHKMKEANLSEEISVRFDKSYHAPKTKLVDIGGIKNKASFCPVIVEGSLEAVKFAWNVGIGNSTGVGFGAVR